MYVAFSSEAQAAMSTIRARVNALNSTFSNGFTTASRAANIEQLARDIEQAAKDLRKHAKAA